MLKKIFLSLGLIATLNFANENLEEKELLKQIEKIKKELDINEDDTRYYPSFLGPNPEVLKFADEAITKLLNKDYRDMSNYLNNLKEVLMKEEFERYTENKRDFEDLLKTIKETKEITILTPIKDEALSYYVVNRKQYHIKKAYVKTTNYLDEHIKKDFIVLDMIIEEDKNYEKGFYLKSVRAAYNEEIK